jgi:orotidine-5'-phosphate decarboxylase
MKAPIAVALDLPTLAEVTALASKLNHLVEMMKIGLQSYLRDGAAGVFQVKEAAPDADIFLDLKLHDIPQTVAGAVKSVAALSPRVLTVHASGGEAMLSAAVSAGPQIDIAAVTILTSLTQPDLATFTPWQIEDVVAKLAKQSTDAGCKAIVCSPQEVKLVRSVVPGEIKLIVPGIRLGAEPADDQKRVATPKSAIDDGADILVIGRLLTSSLDPKLEIQRILNSLDGS